MTLALGLVGASFTTARAQECTRASQPSYRDLPDVLRTLDFRLDTLTVSGNRDLTVVLGSFGTRRTILGRPTEAAVASASAACRLAVLWSTRGDSLVVNWLLEPTRLDLVPDSLELRRLTLSDRPRPIAHTGTARIRTESLYQSMLNSARARSGDDIGAGATMIMTLIDERGFVVLSRLLRSSGVRSLDEAALNIMFTTLHVPPDSAGTPVTAWYVNPISWRR
jgi:hypothetical protein